MKKEFILKRRDGKDAKFTFVKPKESVWYWDLPDGRSLPLPDVELDEAKTLKDCLDLISDQRGESWVGQVMADLLNKDW